MSGVKTTLFLKLFPWWSLEKTGNEFGVKTVLEAFIFCKTSTKSQDSIERIDLISDEN